MSSVAHAPAAKGGLTSTLLRRMLLSSCNRRVAASYLATLAYIGLSYLIVSQLSNFHRSMLQGQWQLDLFGIDLDVGVHDLLIALIALYAVILVPYYTAYPWMRSKAFIFAQGLWFALRRDRAKP